jgi:hypothetical protein
MRNPVIWCAALATIDNKELLRHQVMGGQTFLLWHQRLGGGWVKQERKILAGWREAQLKEG